MHLAPKAYSVIYFDHDIATESEFITAGSNIRNTVFIKNSASNNDNIINPNAILLVY